MRLQDHSKFFLEISQISSDYLFSRSSLADYDHVLTEIRMLPMTAILEIKSHTCEEEGAHLKKFLTFIDKL